MFPSCIAQTAFLRIASVVLVIAVAGCASRGRAPIEDRSLPRAAPQAVPSAAPEASAGPAPVEVRPQTYTVRKGDTLRAIAQDHGIDFRELAQLNNIENPDKIAVGQVLIVSRPGDLSASATGTQTMPLRSVSPVQSAEGGGASALASAAPAPTGGRNTETYKTQPKALKEPYSEHALREIQRAAGNAPTVVAAPAEAAQAPVAVAPPPSATPSPPVQIAVEPKPVAKAPTLAPDDGGKLDWAWPAKGKVVAQFSEATSLKGIDIAGSAGQPVTASAGGKVVYAGSGLRGYGKLIIIKHNDAYLSAYAHNRDILVKEGQQVSKGQKIAEMGNTDTDQVKLHFEIRRQGKPVDPLRYLPPA